MAKFIPGYLAGLLSCVPLILAAVAFSQGHYQAMVGFALSAIGLTLFMAIVTEDVV